MLGLFERFTPKFVKKYEKMNDHIREAVKTYCDEVRSGAFPDDAHSFL
ncbi:MAG: 3-methyl-2-oxobutanoate hydroxymethyltransferase [Syntrophus sp. (in: bacteria)]